MKVFKDSVVAMATKPELSFESLCLSLHTWPQDSPSFRVMLWYHLQKVPFRQGTGLDALSPTRSYHLDASKSVTSEDWASHSPASLPDLVKLWFLKLSQGPGNMDDGNENKWSLWAQDSDAFSYLGSWEGRGRVMWARRSWGKGSCLIHSCVRRAQHNAGPFRMCLVL